MIGDFITKSGRKTPYFFNFGRVYAGMALHELAGAYVALIIKKFVIKSHSSKKTPIVIFGPAYKGIPLAVAITLELERRGVSAVYSFNRKEEKTHGDKGVLVGKELSPKDRVIIIDDVITSGISIGESIALITKTYRAKVLGVVVAVDRGEVAINQSGNLKLTATVALEKQHHLSVHALMKIEEVFTTALRYKLITKKDYQRFSEYLHGEKI